MNLLKEIYLVYKLQWTIMKSQQNNSLLRTELNKEIKYCSSHDMLCIVIYLVQLELESC